MEQRFTDQVVLVIGGGSGIGAAAARRFAEEGARVVIAGRTLAKLEAVAAEAEALNGGGRIEPRVVDATDDARVANLVEDVAARYGRLDVLVNSAGAALQGRAEDTDNQLWRRILDVDLDAVFYASRAAVKHLRQVGGSIVNVASVSGLGADWSAVGYNAAKGAVVNLTRAMALDHGSEGIRVNAVAPSLTVTEMTEGFRSVPEIVAGFAERIPIGRPATAAEVGDVIVFLASRDARFVNGVSLPVDGGLSASSGQPRLL